MNSFHSDKKGFTIDPQNYQTNSKGQYKHCIRQQWYYTQSKVTFSTFFVLVKYCPPKKLIKKKIEKCENETRFTFLVNSR